MPTLADANFVRDKYGETLRRLGAWGVTVDQVQYRGRKTFGIIALFEKQPTAPIPTIFQAARAGKTIAVPVIVRVQERFAPE